MICFLINPAVAADRPNVLIIWDNTANWGQQVTSQTAYSIERQALSQVVSALNDDFNVGLMLFTESGNGTDGGKVCCKGFTCFPFFQKR